MIPTVKAHEMDLSVYGIRQVDYVRDGADGCHTFEEIVADSAFQQATAIDEQAAMVAAALKLRRLKSEDLGRVLAALDGILCSYKSGNPKSDDLSAYRIPEDKVEETKAVIDRVAKYGITIETEVSTEIDDGCDTKTEPGYAYVQIKRGTAMRAQAEVEQMIDAENNNIQQEMSTLQGFVQKRDSAFDSASKVIQKYNGSADNMLDAMG